MGLWTKGKGGFTELHTKFLTSPDNEWTGRFNARQSERHCNQKETGASWLWIGPRLPRCHEID